MHQLFKQYDSLYVFWCCWFSN